MFPSFQCIWWSDEHGHKRRPGGTMGTSRDSLEKDFPYVKDFYLIRSHDERNTKIDDTKEL